MRIRPSGKPIRPGSLVTFGAFPGGEICPDHVYEVQALSVDGQTAYVLTPRGLTEPLRVALLVDVVKVGAEK